MNDIYIFAPYVKKSGEGLYRLCADIRIGEALETVFVETEEAYKDFLVYERADAFVFLTLPIAIREGYNIISAAPVTEMFLHNLNNILIPALAKGDVRVKPIQVIAPSSSDNIGLFNGVCTAVTCGVDSTYTIMKYTSNDLEYKKMKLTHLLVASVSSDLWDFCESDDLCAWEEKHKERFDRYYTISQFTGLPLIKLFTNFATYIIKRREQDESYRHVHVHTFITMSTILALKKLFSVYLFSAAYDLGEFSIENNLTGDTAYYELLLMHILSTPDFMCFSAGGVVDRIDKTVQLTAYPLARKILHPCFKKGKTNCSDPTCNKCLRGLFTLDYFDKLDVMAEVFNVERYRNNRIKYLVSLIKFKEDINFKKLYNLFMDKYPEDMERAKQVYDMEAKPVSRNEYNDLLKAYNTTLILLKEDMPKEAIISFFETRKVKKLYCTGNSRLGKSILQTLSEKIFIEQSADKIEECDAVFISSTSDREIKRIRDNLIAVAIGKNKKVKVMYTIDDIKKELINKDKHTL